MAVINQIEGLEVTIEVDGGTAKEYDPCDKLDSDPPEMLDFHVTASRLANKKPYMVK